MNTKKPNILFILVDCLRADKVFESQGSARLDTINSLTEEGVSFPYMYSSSSTTTVNFASIFTGCYPFNHGVRAHSGNKLHRDLSTLGEELQRFGYTTHAEMTGPAVKSVGLDRGFQFYNYRDRDRTVHTDYGKELPQKINSFQEPWFLFLHLWSLHKPRQILPRFQDSKFGTPYEKALTSLDHYLSYLLSDLNKEPLVLLHGDHGEEITSSTVSRYINRAAQTLKPLKEKLKKVPGADKIVRKGGKKLDFISETAGHGFHVYDHLTRVPLIINGPGFDEGLRLNYPVKQPDLFPTIINLANSEEEDCSVPKNNGVNLAQFGEEKKNTAEEIYLEECGLATPSKEHMLQGIRTQNYKYIFSPFGNSKPELYNLEKDPKETNNLLPEQKQLEARLKSQLQELIEREKFVTDNGGAGSDMSEKEEKRTKEKLRDLGYL